MAETSEAEMSIPDERAPARNNRLERLGYGGRLKPVRLQALSKKMETLIRAIVYGVDEPGIARLTRKIKSTDEQGNTVVTERPLACGEPLSAIEAGDYLRIRRRQVRDLLAQPIFSAALAKEIHALKNGEKARSLATVIQLRDDEGDNSAATKKVRLASAQTILEQGGEGKRSSGVTINNNVIGGVSVKPGYMVRVPQQSESAYSKPGRPTIDAQFWTNAGGRPSSSSSAPDDADEPDEAA
jgi:hypothetical protein